jgi:hypothetical protein
MPSRCFTPLKIPRVRVTRLDSCGMVVTGDCSQVVTDGIISVEMAKNYEDREEFFVKNGDGFFCVRETNPPILKWIDLTLTFCNVDPDIVNIISGEPLVYSDDTAQTKIGWSTEEGSVANVNFAFEGWTRLSLDSNPCSGGDGLSNGVEFGYVLFPWVVEGTIGDMTLENGVANFVVTARTRSQSLWGVGPYNVDLSDNPATLDTPIPLLTPIGSRQHHRMFITRLDPPAASCGCAAV